jgi:hypothetical protein
MMPWLKSQFGKIAEERFISITEIIPSHTDLDLWIPVHNTPSGYKIMSYKGSGDLIGFAGLSGLIYCPCKAEIENKSHFLRYYPL